MSANLARRGTSEVVPPPATENAARSAPPTAGKYDSALVGRVVQRRPHDPSETPKNVTLSLWGVTWWLKLTEVARRARLFSYRVFGMVPPIPDNDNRNAEEWGV